MNARGHPRVTILVAFVLLCGFASLGATQPIHFIENQGQWDDGVSFLARKGPMTAWFHADGWTVDYEAASEALPGNDADDLGPGAGPRVDGPVLRTGVVVRMAFEGAQGLAPRGSSRIPGYFNFFLGNEPKRWASRVPAFQRLHYAAMYPGVDVLVREQAGRLEYDLRLEPGARLDQVVVRCDGIDGIAIDTDGALVMKTRYATLRQAAPKTWYALPSGQRLPVRCDYRLLGDGRYGFAVAESRDAALVIDPGLEWSTYLGGTENDRSFDVVVDPSTGFVTVQSRTDSSDFPTTLGAYKTTNRVNQDIAVSQLDPSQSGASQLRWSTYLGGFSDERCRSLSADPAGTFTLVCSTFSGDFPTKNAFNPSWPGSWTGAVARLDKDGANLLYGTFIGGSGNDWFSNSHRPVVDANGVITFTGQTWSTNFPTMNAFRGNNSGSDDAVVVRLDPTKAGTAQLVYSTYLGGSNRDGARQLAIDANGIITVGGWTESADFPTTSNAFPFGGGVSPQVYDGWVSRLDLTKTGTNQLVWSTHFGGSGTTLHTPVGDAVSGLTLTQSGLIVITGTTDSPDLPMSPNAFDPTYNGGGTANSGGDAFLAYLDPSKAPNQSLVYNTFLGGSGGNGDSGWSVAVDSAGTATVAGWASCNGDYPVTPGAFQTTFGTATSLWQGVVTRLRPGPMLLYSTYVGGQTPFGTGCFGLALEPTGGAVVCGDTDEAVFPTTQGAYQTTYAGGQYDSWAARFDMLPTGATRFGTSTPSCQGPVFMGVTEMPASPAPSFAFMCTNAPPSTTGYLVLGFVQIPNGLRIPGYDFTLLVGPPAAAIPVTTDSTGFAVTALPIPAGITGVNAYGQYLFSNTSSCGGAGKVSASYGLHLQL